MFLQTVIVVSDVPVDIKMLEIENKLEVSSPVMKIKRMQRWNKDAAKAEDCDKLKITVRATTLPKFVKMYGANIPYDYFIPHCMRKLMLQPKRA